MTLHEVEKSPGADHTALVDRGNVSGLWRVAMPRPFADP